LQHLHTTRGRAGERTSYNHDTLSANRAEHRWFLLRPLRNGIRRWSRVMLSWWTDDAADSSNADVRPCAFVRLRVGTSASRSQSSRSQCSSQGAAEPHGERAGEQRHDVCGSHSRVGTCSAPFRRTL